MNYKITDENYSEVVNSPEKVFGYIFSKEFTEENYLRAKDAKCWCELASAGDTYTDDQLVIECVYNFWEVKKSWKENWQQDKSRIRPEHQWNSFW